MWTLTGIWFLSHDSSAQFDRCAYIIDLIAGVLGHKILIGRELSRDL